MKELDDFLIKVQQPKMKELWDNEEDESWEDSSKHSKTQTYSNKSSSNLL